MKSASAKLFLDLHAVSAPSGPTLNAAAQVERAALSYASAASATLRRTAAGCAVWVTVGAPLKRRRQKPQASGLRVTVSAAAAFALSAVK